MTNRLFSAESSNGDSADDFFSVGGVHSVAVWGTFDGATVKVLRVMDFGLGGETVIETTDLVFTEAGWKNVELVPGTRLRGNITGVGTSSLNLDISPGKI